MDNNPETPSEGTPQGEGTPTTDMSGSYSPPPPPTDAGNWQPGQYSSGAPGGVGQAVGSTSMPPPAYSQAQAQPEVPTAQSGYASPAQQGQPTQYMQPQQYAPPSSPPTVPMQNQPPNYNPGDYNTGYPQQPMSYAQPKDPTAGLLLELLGYIGFLGIGHIWAGKTTRGIVLLVGWWIYLACSGVLTIVLIGCVMLVAALVIPIASGLYLRNEMQREQAAMGIRR